MQSFSWNKNGALLLRKKWKAHFGWQVGVLAKMFATEHAFPSLLILVNDTTIQQIAQSENMGVHSPILSFHYIHIQIITKSHSSEIYPEI